MGRNKGFQFYSGKGFLYYFVLYDLNDNLIAYFDTLIEFKSQFHYEIKELNRKFKNSRSNFILFNIENKKYKLYKFNILGGKL